MALIDKDNINVVVLATYSIRRQSSTFSRDMFASLDLHPYVLPELHHKMWKTKIYYNFMKESSFFRFMRFMQNMYIRCKCRYLEMPSNY